MGIDVYQRFETDGLPPDVQKDAWTSYHASLFPTLQFESHVKGAARCEHWQSDDVSFIKYRCHSHEVTQRKVGSYLKLLLPQQGGTTFSDGHSKVAVNEGDLIVYDMSAPYQISNAGNVDHRIILLPHAAVHAQGRQQGALGRHSFRHFDRSSPFAGLLVEFISSTFSSVDRFDEGQLHTAGSFVSRLLRSALEESADKNGVSSSLQYIYGRAAKIIDDSLRDHELTVDEIVRRLNCSRRSLYTSFSGTGQTPHDMIVSKRLEGVRADLRRPELRSRTILEIIYSWGFEEQKSFCRMFKQRYGISASAYRRTSN